MVYYSALHMPHLYDFCTQVGCTLGTITSVSFLIQGMIYDCFAIEKDLSEDIDIGEFHRRLFA